MSEVFVLLPGAKQLYTFDWSAEIPAESPMASISSVSYVISPATSPEELRAYVTSEDAFSEYLTTVGLTGALVGRTYQVKAICVLSNGEHLSKSVTFKGYSG